MKELSIEQKAKAYDEAIEKAKIWQEHLYDVNDKDYADELNYIFPELKESEDDRIRKALIDVLSSDFEKDTEIHGITVGTIITWLEKQGEQTPTDKVEPKFHEGEWITNGDYTWKIVEVKPLDYILRSQDGNVVDDTISHVDDQFHSFTIKDAKDGDIVVDKSDGTVGIFQSIGYYPDGGRFNDPSYCFLHCRYDDGFFWADFEHGNTIDSDDLIPATKEQRDALLKAMTDAGYTFDFEKKELKKVEQNPAWSEEDDRMLNEIIASVNGFDATSGTITMNFGKHEAKINWLKTIKYKALAQPSDEWSEEDESLYMQIEGVLSVCRTKNIISFDLYKKMYDLLKFLKDRIQLQPKWKPSDEQMEGLLWVLENCAEREGSSKMLSLANSIYDDLKKLREE